MRHALWMQQPAAPAAPNAPAPPSAAELRQQIREQVQQARDEALREAQQARQQAQQAREQAQQAREQAQAARAQTAPSPPGEPQILVPPMPPMGPTPTQVIDLAVTVMIIIAVIIVGLPIARALGRRIDRGGPQRLDADTDQRLKRIEQGVEAVAIEVERISEAQRYMARIQSERGGEPVGLPREAGKAGTRDAPLQG